MPKNSTLGNTFVDDLLDTIDSLRDEVYNEFGVRQYTVNLVVREWSGGEVGAGTVSVVSTTTLAPKPLVTDATTYNLDPEKACGVVDIGNLILQEVSLQYDFAELTGGNLDPDQEFYIELVDAHGQHIPTTYWVPAADPVPDRMRKMAWELVVRPYSRPVAL